MRSAAELEELKLICPGAAEIPEGNITYVLLPDLQVPNYGRVDGLLCPQDRDGYPTRLFLAVQIPGKGANWSQHRILDRSWWSCSFKDVWSSMRLAEILAAHLGGLR